MLLMRQMIVHHISSQQLQMLRLLTASTAGLLHFCRLPFAYLICHIALADVKVTFNECWQCQTSDAVVASSCHYCRWQCYFLAWSFTKRLWHGRMVDTKNIWPIKTLLLISKGSLPVKSKPRKKTREPFSAGLLKKGADGCGDICCWQFIFTAWLKRYCVVCCSWKTVWMLPQTQLS